MMTENGEYPNTMRWNGRSPNASTDDSEAIAMLAIRLLESGSLPEIIGEISKRTGGANKIGELYATIKRLKLRGLVTSTQRPTTNSHGRRASTAYYRLTDDGKIQAWSTLLAFFGKPAATADPRERNEASSSLGIITSSALGS